MRVSRLFTGRGLRGGCNDAKGREREGGGQICESRGIERGTNRKRGLLRAEGRCLNPHTRLEIVNEVTAVHRLERGRHLLALSVVNARQRLLKNVKER